MKSSVGVLLFFVIPGATSYPSCSSITGFDTYNVCSGCAGCDITASVPQSCPPHSLTGSNGSSNPLDCKCLAGYYGTVTEAVAADSCQACPNGSYSLAIGAAAMATCIQCVPGYYCPSISSSAVACAPGTYNADSRSTLASKCVPFPPGKYGNLTAATSLDDATFCSVGMYSVAEGATEPSTCVECPVGQFCATVGTAPLPCTVLPATGATYHGPGTTETNCPWTCDSGYYLAPNGTACLPCPAASWCIANVKNTCPTNSYSEPQSWTQNQCICSAGYYGDGSKVGTSPCTLCRAGSYCGGGNLNMSLECPENSTTGYGAALLGECQCWPGYVGDNGTACALCGLNTYCKSGNLSLCPAHSSAPSRSSAVVDCVANPGYYTLSPGDVPVVCPPNFFCTGGLALLPCTANAVSPEESPSALSCFCDRGYEGVNNSVCKPCAMGTWCWTGVLNNCPDHSTSPPLSSYMGNCSCLPGYGGTVDNACVQCFAGTYKADYGNHGCTSCVSGDTFATNNTATRCVPCFRCPLGWFTTESCTLVSDAVCSTCPDNYQCHDGIMTACPAPTVSSNASSYLDCMCPEGMFGQVLSESSAYCEICPTGMFCPAVVTQCTCSVGTPPP